jgi:tetratricopeptide (TPR) repeat protein
MSNADYLQIAYGLRNKIRTNPEQKAELLLSMADAYIKGRSYSNAALVSRTILKLEPLNVRAMIRLGKASLGEKKTEVATKLFETITGLVPELEEGLWGLWASYVASKRYKDAIHPIEKLTSLHPKDESLLLKTIKTCEDGEDKKKTIQYLRELIETGPEKYADKNLHLSRLLAETGNLSAALSYMDKYLKVNMGDENTLTLAAKAAAKLKKWDLCAKYATQRIENGTFSPDGLYMLGTSRIHQNRWDEAILVLEQLVEKLPEQLNYRMSLGEAYFRSGELDCAQREYSRCLARQPERFDIIVRMAEISWRRGDRENASRLYERTLRFNPAMALALFRLGFIKFDKGLYPAAISLFRRLLVIKPENYKANLFLGQALRLTGSYDKAKTYLSRSLELVPGQSKPHLELGLLYKAIRQETLAKEHFKAAIKNDSGGTVSKDAAYELQHMEREQIDFEKIKELPIAANGNVAFNLKSGPTEKQKPGNIKWIKL